MKKALLIVAAVLLAGCAKEGAGLPGSLAGRSFTCTQTDIPVTIRFVSGTKYSVMNKGTKAEGLYEIRKEDGESYIDFVSRTPAVIRDVSSAAVRERTTYVFVSGELSRNKERGENMLIVQADVLRTFTYNNPPRENRYTEKGKLYLYEDTDE